MYEVYLEHHAERDLKSLPTDIFQRIIPHIKGLANNPRPSGSKKLTGSKHDWRIRVGDYRVIYEISDKEKLIRVMGVRHRKEVYR